MNIIEEKIKQFLSDYGGSKAEKVPLDTLKEDFSARLSSIKDDSHPTLSLSIGSIIRMAKKKKDLKSFLIFVTEKMFSFSDLGDV